MTVCEIRATGGFTQEHLLRLFTRAPRAFWRFDVDVSLEAAAKMARFAELAGVRGTFYVMARGEFYNPFSRGGSQAISAIHNTGHRIGLHVDHIGGRPQDGVQRDGRLMLNGGYLGIVDPELVSFHMPSRSVLWQDFDGFENAYGSRWKDHYVSDSRREWDDDKEDAVVNSIRNSVRTGHGIQVALHPEHWFSC